MYDLEKSDIMVCNTKANLTWKHKKENDMIFFKQMGGTVPTKIRNVEAEFFLKTCDNNPRKYVCNDNINTRGGNAIVSCPDLSICQGYNCFTDNHMGEYLMIPCKTNTYRNYIECDNDKCCSVHHQMFDNMTKRR